MLKSKVKLNVGLIYSNIFCAVGSILMIAGIVMLFVFPPENLILMIILLMVFSILAVICFIAFVFLCQSATLCEKGIIFKCIFFKIADIAWVDIVKIEIISLETLESRMSKFSFNWIVFFRTCLNNLKVVEETLETNRLGK